MARMRPLALVAAALVALPSISSAAALDLEKEVEEIVLDNGMTFLVVRRPGSGVFAAYLRVRVGGADERPGATGVAHLFEHMAFKGTQVIGTTDWEKERAILLEVYELGEALSRERARRDA